MNFNRPLILASSSPRRQFLLTEAGFSFTVDAPNIDESFPNTMLIENVPGFLADKKAAVFLPKIRNEVVIAADTVVILGNAILNKPKDRNEAIEMLSLLKGKQP